MDDDDFDALYLDLMKEFLADATPTQWLAVATTMNYDGANALLDWMGKHPKLEPAVAKALYWYQQPGYFQHYAEEAKVPGINRAGWARIHALAQRVEGGKLAAATIGWDPANDLSSPTGNDAHPGYDWTSEAVQASEAKWQIPAFMLTAVPGTQPDIYAYVDDQDWEEGMPPHVRQALDEAMEEDELDNED